MSIADREGDIGGNVWMILTIFLLSVLAFVKRCCHKLQLALEMTHLVVAMKDDHEPMEQEGRRHELLQAASSRLPPAMHNSNEAQRTRIKDDSPPAVEDDSEVEQQPAPPPHLPYNCHLGRHGLTHRHLPYMGGGRLPCYNNPKELP